jgi:hypothetical protein
VKREEESESGRESEIEKDKNGYEKPLNITYFPYCNIVFPNCLTRSAPYIR